MKSVTPSSGASCILLPPSLDAPEFQERVKSAQERAPGCCLEGRALGSVRATVSLGVGGTFIWGGLTSFGEWVSFFEPLGPPWHLLCYRVRLFPVRD